MNKSIQLDRIGNIAAKVNFTLKLTKYFIFKEKNKSIISKNKENNENASKSISNEKSDESEQNLKKKNNSKCINETNPRSPVIELIDHNINSQITCHSRNISNENINPKNILKIDLSENDSESDELDFNESKEKNLIKKLRRPLKRKSKNEAIHINDSMKQFISLGIKKYFYHLTHSYELSYL